MTESIGPYCRVSRFYRAPVPFAPYTIHYTKCSEVHNTVGDHTGLNTQLLKVVTQPLRTLQAITGYSTQLEGRKRREGTASTTIVGKWANRLTLHGNVWRTDEREGAQSPERESEARGRGEREGGEGETRETTARGRAQWRTESSLWSKALSYSERGHTWSTRETRRQLSVRLNSANVPKPSSMIPQRRCRSLS